MAQNGFGSLFPLFASSPGSFAPTDVLALTAVAAAILFTILQSDQSGDDDDSGPGGGLMQPVGSRA
jgi:hypothetical protein